MIQHSGPRYENGNCACPVSPGAAATIELRMRQHRLYGRSGTLASGWSRIVQGVHDPLYNGELVFDTLALLLQGFNFCQFCVDLGSSRNQTVIGCLHKCARVASVDRLRSEGCRLHRFRFGWSCEGLWLHNGRSCGKLSFLDTVGIT